MTRKSKAKHETEPNRHQWLWAERVKELTCLHELGRVLEQKDASMERLLEEAVQLLPPAWQYPEDAAACIEWGVCRFQTEAFPKAMVSLSTDLRVRNHSAGKVLVAYRNDHPEADEGPFLKEERALLDTFAQWLGSILERIRAREEAHAAIQQHQATEQQLRAANQQLAASNQQLRANEQQLRASNQQLCAAKEQAERNEHYYHTLLNSMGDPVFVKDAESRLMLVNDAFCEAIALSRSDILGKTLAEEVAPQESEHFLKIDREVLTTGREHVTEETLTVRGGDKRFVSTRKNRFEDASGTVFLLGVIRDISARKQAEQALHESQQHLEAIWSVMDVGIALIDAETRLIRRANPALLAMSGYSEDELVGRVCHTVICPVCVATCPIADLHQELDRSERVLIHKDGHNVHVEKTVTPILLEGRQVYVETLVDITDRKIAEAHLRRLAAAIEHSPETVVITDGEGTIQYVNPAFEASTGYAPEEVIGKNTRILKSGQQDPDFYTTMWDTLLSGKVWEGRMVNRRKDGLYFTEEASIAPVRNPDGSLAGYVAVKRDITAELARDEQMAQAQKLESIGQLAGGVAHDFNNLLMGIMNYVELCRDELDAEHPAFKWLDEITADAQRSADLTRQLLAFARHQTIAPKVLDLNDAISGMLRMVQRLIGEDIHLAWKPGPSLRSVKMDPSQLDQLVANLCVNARDAIGGVGKITIETENVELDADYCANHAEVVPGAYIMLAVSDTGCGMNRDTLEHVFEPFFTTKDVGEGTGLGLATIYGIVKQNDGHINVYSEPGQGATFRIYLPQCEEEAPGEVVSTDKAPRVGGNDTILLVEDEKSVRVTTLRFLQNLGYTVLAADAPEEALRLAQGHDAEVHLLITDVVMPGMNGRELAVKLAEAYPHMRCLYMSGYTADVIAHRGILEENVHFLSKPFSRDGLARKVREVLDGE